MTRRKDTARNLAGSTSQAGEDVPLTEHGDDVLAPSDESEIAGPAKKAADPFPVMMVNLSDYAGGPSAHLLRSHRFKQMQIRFEREQPDDQYLESLRKAGWRDRCQEEGVWTKQIDPQARWQSVAQMEQEFKAVANAIREAKGMKPVLESRAMA